MMPSHSDQLVLVDELRRAERQATLARLARAFAHLIGTPLNVISGRAGLIRAAGADEATVENARRIEAQVERLAARVRRLIDHFTLQEPESKLVSLSSVLENALELYGPVAAARGIELAHAAEKVDDVQVDSTSTLLVLTNLLSLAMLTASGGARVELAHHPLGSNLVAFEIRAPGLAAPNFRIDSLEPPPESSEPADGQYQQVLSLCYAVAEQGGAKLEVEPGLLRLTSPVR